MILVPLELEIYDQKRFQIISLFTNYVSRCIFRKQITKSNQKQQ